MCYTGKCPYEQFMGDCSIKDREELKVLLDAGCNMSSNSVIIYCEWIIKDNYIDLISNGTELASIRDNYNGIYTVFRIGHRTFNIGGLTLKKAMNFVKNNLYTR